MRGTVLDELKVGDYAKFRGHRIQEHLQLMWWKITGIDGDRLLLVNRENKTARVNRRQRYQHCHALKWEPGDDRNDDTADTLY